MSNVIIIYYRIIITTGDVKEVRIFGGHLGPHCWPKAIDMVCKKQLPIDDIITHTYPLSQFLEGIQMVLQSALSIKVTLVPNFRLNTA